MFDVDLSGATMTHQVGTKKPNGLGIHDMSGNVFEWVWDLYYDEYPAEAQTDPTGPAPGTAARTRRGGSHGDDLINLAMRSAQRSYRNPHQRNDYMGLRPVRR